jgi:osmotically-inducible protein OsmY
MFPASISQTDPDELLRCRESSPSSEEKPHEHDKNRLADADLAHEVDTALRQDTILRALDYNSIEIHVRNGIVGLYGHVVSLTNRHQAEKAAQSVGGARGLTNRLIADDRLLSEVATALGSLEHAYGCKFFTGVSHGVVMLSGTVDDPKTRLLAEQYAASNPNVRGVINSVRVRGGGLDLPDLPFLQPGLGAEFFFLDGMSGRVRQVIIDPGNRRVAAMTLQGRFEDWRQDPNSSSNGGSRPPIQTLVLRMTTVRYLTRESGFLNIRYSQSNQYWEFNATDFLMPPKGWKPPYPYCPADVLFPAKQVDAATHIPEQFESPVALALAHQVLKDELLENDSLGG